MKILPKIRGYSDSKRNNLWVYYVRNKNYLLKVFLDILFFETTPNFFSIFEFLEKEIRKCCYSRDYLGRIDHGHFPNGRTGSTSELYIKKWNVGNGQYNPSVVYRVIQIVTNVCGLGSFTVERISEYRVCASSPNLPC